MVWALGIFSAFQLLAESMYVKMEMAPSEDPQAKARPNSCGAQETELTDESWPVYSYNRLQRPGESSRQRMTFMNEKI